MSIDSLDEALEILKENLERVFNHPVSIEDAHLVAALVSSLITAGFTSLETAHHIMSHSVNVANIRQIMRLQRQRHLTKQTGKDSANKP